MTLKDFVEHFYLKYIEEKRASTRKSYKEIWDNHISERVGHIRVREFRTVDASRMLKAIASEKDLTRTTLQHIKGVLSGIFTHAKNEGAFDGENPVRDVHIPSTAREPGETFAYNLKQICLILDSLPLLPKAAVATAAFAGLREGELRGLDWTDYEQDALRVNRSVWKTFVNKPKTRASANSVPVIRQLAEILDDYRKSIGNPATGVMLHNGSGIVLGVVALRGNDVGFVGEGLAGEPTDLGVVPAFGKTVANLELVFAPAELARGGRREIVGQR